MTFLTWAELGSQERVLGSFVFAGCFRADAVLADPTGRLAATGRRVAAEFAAPGWVRRRCVGVREPPPSR
ncbi:hypothetical protein ACVCAH_15075 [Micromonospora sp. LZ34]